jgi:exodeoxyribonuclease VII large subunit
LLERRETELAKRGERALRAKRERLERLRLQLEERNPRQILQRGYAIATDVAGRVLASSDQVSVGNIVKVELHQGKLITEVKAKE